MSIFEKATRKKIRFATPKGLISAEDLWDISLTELNKVAVALHNQVEATPTVSFIETNKKPEEAIQLAFEIAKHIINVRLAENEAAKAEKELKAKKQKIMEVIARKEDSSLEDTDISDLKKMLEDLGS